MDIVNYSFVFLNLLIGVILSIAVGRGAIWAAKKWGLMDVPGSLPHKMHLQPTPLAGGIILYVCLILWIIFSGSFRSEHMLKLILPLTIIFGFGIWDDIKRIRARYKLIGQLLAGIVLLLSGVSIQVLENLVGTGSQYFQLMFILDRLITLFWIVGVTNAFNLIDSMDELAIGLANLSFAFFMLACIDSRQVDLIQIFSVLLGIGVGISLYNASPAKLFLGDSGAQSIGLLLAVLGIFYAPLDKAPAATWFVPILLVAVPIFDTSLVFFSRLKQNNPFYLAAHDHTYHRLVGMKIDPKRAVMIIHIAALMIDCVAFIAVSLPWQYSNLLFVGILGLGILAFIYLEKAVMYSPDVYNTGNGS